MVLRRLAVLGFWAAVSMGGACGGSDNGGSGGSGVSGSKRIDSLTLDEKKSLCDYEAAHFGGYGKSMDCGGGNTLDADTSQDDCVSMFPTNCAVTVSQAEQCTTQQSCSNPFPQSCAAVLACLFSQ